MSQGEGLAGDYGPASHAWSGHLLSLLLTGRRRFCPLQDWVCPSLPGHLQLQLLPEARRQSKAQASSFTWPSFTVITTEGVPGEVSLANQNGGCDSWEQERGKDCLGGRLISA